MSADRPHKPNTGVLFPKAPKWIAEKQGRPHSTGEASIACPTCNCIQTLRVAAWAQTSKKGNPYQSLQFSQPVKPKEEGGEQ